MPEEMWDEARIAKLRRLAQEAKHEDAHAEFLGEATVRYCIACDYDTVLSLLDALESTRKALDAAVEEVHDLRLGANQ